MSFLKKKHIKIPIVAFLIFAFLLQSFPLSAKAGSDIFDIVGGLLKWINNLSLPDEVEITERGDLIAKGVEAFSWDGNIAECICKRCNDGHIDCGANKVCAGECVSPFSINPLTEILDVTPSQTDVELATLALPKICQLTVPLAPDKQTLSRQERLDIQKACRNLRNIKRAAAKEAYFAKRIFNNTDPISECNFITNCRSSCQLRFGTFAYRVSIFEVLSWIGIPGSWILTIKRVFDFADKIYQVYAVLKTVETTIKSGVTLLNAFFSQTNHLATFFTAFGYLLNVESDSSFGEMLEHYADNLLKYNRAKTQALVQTKQSQRKASELTTFLEEEPGIDFLFTDPSSKKAELQDIIDRYLNNFDSLEKIMPRVINTGAFLDDESLEYLDGCRLLGCSGEGQFETCDYQCVTIPDDNTWFNNFESIHQKAKLLQQGLVNQEYESCLEKCQEDFCQPSAGGCAPDYCPNLCAEFDFTAEDVLQLLEEIEALKAVLTADVLALPIQEDEIQYWQIEEISRVGRRRAGGQKIYKNPDITNFNWDANIAAIQNLTLQTIVQTIENREALGLDLTTIVENPIINLQLAETERKLREVETNVGLARSQHSDKGSFDNALAEINNLKTSVASIGSQFFAIKQTWAIESEERTAPIHLLVDYIEKTIASRDLSKYAAQDTINSQTILSQVESDINSLLVLPGLSEAAQVYLNTALSLLHQVNQTLFTGISNFVGSWQCLQGSPVLGGCSDNSVEQVFSPELAGCNGSTIFDQADSLCAPGWQPVILDVNATARELLLSTPSNGPWRWLSKSDGNACPLTGYSDHCKCFTGGQCPCTSAVDNNCWGLQHGPYAQNYEQIWVNGHSVGINGATSYIWAEHNGLGCMQASPCAAGNGPHTSGGVVCERSISFLNNLRCFIEDNAKESFEEILDFLKVIEKLEDTAYELVEVEKTIPQLKPEIRMEALQMKSDIDLAQMGKDLLDGKSVSFDMFEGENPESFSDFTDKVIQNPISFLNDQFADILHYIANIVGIDETSYIKQIKNTDLAFEDPLREREFSLGIESDSSSLSGKVLGLHRLVFGEEELRNGCKALGLILMHDPQDLRTTCDDPETLPLLEDEDTEEMCWQRSNLISALQKGIVLEELLILESGSDRVQWWKDNVCGPSIDESHRYRCMPCYSKSRRGQLCQRTQINQLCPQEWIEADERDRDNWDVCWDYAKELRSMDTEEISAEIQSIKEMAGENGAEICDQLEYQKGVKRDCDYLDLLEKALADDCRKEDCDKVRANVSGLVTYCSGWNGSIPDLTEDTALLDEARQVCDTKLTDIKTPLEEIMTIYSILMGIRSGTLFFRGIASSKRAAQDFYEKAQAMIAAIKELPEQLKTSSEKQLSSGGFSWKIVECESQPATSWHRSEPGSSKGTSSSGPLGGPVCPKIDSFFSMIDGQFSLMRYNLQQMDEDRRVKRWAKVTVSQEDMEAIALFMGGIGILTELLVEGDKLLGLIDMPETVLKGLKYTGYGLVGMAGIMSVFRIKDIKASLFPIFEKKYPTQHPVNTLFNQAEAIESKARIVWALATAIDFANKNCTCGQSFCKLHLCISGMPLTLAPLQEPYCYLVYTLRYALEKYARKLEKEAGLVSKGETRGPSEGQDDGIPEWPVIEEFHCRPNPSEKCLVCCQNATPEAKIKIYYGPQKVGEMTTDADGYAEFDASALRGEGTYLFQDMSSKDVFSQTIIEGSECWNQCPSRE